MQFCFSGIFDVFAQIGAKIISPVTISAYVAICVKVAEPIRFSTSSLVACVPVRGAVLRISPMISTSFLRLGTWLYIERKIALKLCSACKSGYS